MTDTPERIHLSWPIEGGTVTLDIETTEPLPADVYGSLGVIVAAVQDLRGALQADDMERPR